MAAAAAGAAGEGIREEEEDEPDADVEDERPPSSSPPPASSFDSKLALRRQSAPAASIALGASDTPPGTEAEDEVLTKMRDKFSDM